jgi:hypothetical protein
MRKLFRYGGIAASIVLIAFGIRARAGAADALPERTRSPPPARRGPHRMRGTERTNTLGAIRTKQAR